MKRILNSEIIYSNIFVRKRKTTDKFKLFFIIVILILWITNEYIIISYITNYNFIKLNNKNIEININNSLEINNRTHYLNSNLYFHDEFINIKGIKEQIIRNNITNIETISAWCKLRIGNALIVLNNLINICINIKCKNIIMPQGSLRNIIKKPIFIKDFNITISPYPNNFKKDTNIYIDFNVFFFRYKNSSNKIRLSIIKEEVLNNIPKYNANINDLYIHIRSGDIFLNSSNIYYSQPPLCFYQKIIDENKYNNIYLFSNGYENPIINRLFKIYPKIKYINNNEQLAIAIIINAYNLVISTSTFPITLIWLNNNLKNLYLYNLLNLEYLRIINDNFKYVNYNIYKMEPSETYNRIMNKKWKKSKEQIDLMLKENCKNTSFSHI